MGNNTCPLCPSLLVASQAWHTLAVSEAAHSCLGEQNRTLCVVLSWLRKYQITMILSILPTIFSLAFLMVILGSSTLVMEARMSKTASRRRRSKVAISDDENNNESG